MRQLRRGLLAALALAALLGGLVVLGATPASAAAVAFTVNSLADASDAMPGNGTCATAGSVYTLRAAIEEANAGSASNTYTVSFSVAGTMQEGSTALPNVNRAITLDGSTAPGYAAATGPRFFVSCNGSSDTSNSGIGVIAADVTIRALGIVNCGTAIITSAESTGLEVVGSYLGTDGASFAANRAVRAGRSLRPARTASSRTVSSARGAGVADLRGAGITNCLPAGSRRRRSP